MTVKAQVREITWIDEAPFDLRTGEVILSAEVIHAPERASDFTVWRVVIARTWSEAIVTGT